MKKLCLSLAVVVLTTLSANAQVQFGAKGGLNIANLGGDGLSGQGISSLISFHIGGQVSIPIAGKFSIQPEALYSGEGAKATGGKLLFNYLNIPVLAEYNIAKGLNVEAGPQLGFLLSAEAKPTSGASTDLKSDLKSTDFALVLGLNYKFTENIGADARYNIGLSDINATSGTNNSISNDVLQIGVFYLFNTK
jgi:opacity protein-like surface antigen